MLSLSDNEFSVVNFLVRNFTERLTIRDIAKRLGFSPAGVFNILKKLEANNIVAGERLGTGLFYTINFDDAIANHLTAIVLLYSEEGVAKIDAARLSHAKAAILDKKNILLVIDNVTFGEIAVPDFNVIAKTEDEIAALWRKKDAEMLQLLKNGVVLFGEDKIAGIIKNCISGF